MLQFLCYSIFYQLANKTRNLLFAIQLLVYIIYGDRTIIAIIICDVRSEKWVRKRETLELRTDSVWPDCGHGHTYPVHGWPFCGGFEIVPEKVRAGLRPVGEIIMDLFI
jgi:hypothetical protein